MAIQNSEKNDIEGKEVIIIPVYNEERIIDTTVQSIIDKKYENIIVVNDGSTDDTLSKIQAFWDNVTVLHHYSNRWQGASLETGFEYVRRYWNTNYVVCFDADGQHSISDLNTFYEILDVQPDIDIVFGSRFLKKTYSNVPFVRKMILKWAILFTFFLSHIRLTDSHNGYRVMRRKVLDKIHISIDGMWHASEIIDIVASKKIPFAEVPVHIHYTDYSLEKWQSSGNALQIVARFIWNKFFK